MSNNSQTGVVRLLQHYRNLTIRLLSIISRHSFEGVLPLCRMGNDGNKGVLRLSQNSSITGTSPSNCLALYPGHSFEGDLLLCRMGNDGNKGVLRISRSSSITGISPSDYLASYQDTHLKESYPFAEWATVAIRGYSTFPRAPATSQSDCLMPYPRHSLVNLTLEAVGVFYSPSQMGNDGNKGVFCIPQSSSITGTSPPDYIVSYAAHSLLGSYSSAEKQHLPASQLSNVT